MFTTRCGNVGNQHAAEGFATKGMCQFGSCPSPRSWSLPRRQLTRPTTPATQAREKTHPNAQANNPRGSSPQAGRARPLSSCGHGADGVGEEEPNPRTCPIDHQNTAGDGQSAHPGVQHASAHAAGDSGVLMVQGKKGGKFVLVLALASSILPEICGGSSYLWLAASQRSQKGHGLSSWERSRGRQQSCITLDLFWGETGPVQGE